MDEHRVESMSNFLVGNRFTQHNTFSVLKSESNAYE